MNDKVTIVDIREIEKLDILLNINIINIDNNTEQLDIILDDMDNEIASRVLNSETLIQYVAMKIISPLKQYKINNYSNLDELLKEADRLAEKLYELELRTKVLNYPYLKYIGVTLLKTRMIKDKCYVEYSQIYKIRDVY